MIQISNSIQGSVANPASNAMNRLPYGSWARFSLVAILVLLIVSTALWLGYTDHHLPEVDASRASHQNSTASDPVISGEAEIVRILARHGADGSELPRETVLSSVVHRGALSGPDLESLQDKLKVMRDMADQSLRDSRADASDSSAILAEAKSMLRSATRQDALHALDQGTYIVSFAGDATPPLTLPESEVIRVLGHGKDGVPATITIIIPWASHPRTAEARSYFDSVLSWDDSEKARKFNELPDVQRHELAQRIARIMENPQSTDEERRFVRETIGFATNLQRASAIVIVPDRR
ncbi:MAG: hypothetical protein ACK501_11510 [Planctomycetota bacterium]